MDFFFSLFDKITSIPMTIDVGVTLVSVAAAGVAFREYRSNQSWKRREYASGLLSRLSSDSILRSCCVFLDWEARRMPIPDYYLVFISENEPRYFAHTTDKLERALNKKLEIDLSQASASSGIELTEDQMKAFSWQEVMYRDYFDQFFEYLSEIEFCISTGLIFPQDVEPLKYWLDKVLIDQRQIFRRFLKDYRYDRVVLLGRAFGIMTPKEDLT